LPRGGRGFSLDHHDDDGDSDEDADGHTHEASEAACLDRDQRVGHLHQDERGRHDDQRPLRAIDADGGDQLGHQGEGVDQGNYSGHRIELLVFDDRSKQFVQPVRGFFLPVHEPCHRIGLLS